jgi:hypothetical protein
MYFVDPRAGEIGESGEVLGPANHCVSKRPIWLAEAAEPPIARSPTTQRIAGSQQRRSVIHVFIAGKRPSTDWRSKPTNRWRLFSAVRASAPVSVGRSASSNSR